MEQEVTRGGQEMGTGSEDGHFDIIGGRTWTARKKLGERVADTLAQCGFLARGSSTCCYCGQRLHGFTGMHGEQGKHGGHRLYFTMTAVVVIQSGPQVVMRSLLSPSSDAL